MTGFGRLPGFRHHIFGLFTGGSRDERHETVSCLENKLFKMTVNDYSLLLGILRQCVGPSQEALYAISI